MNWERNETHLQYVCIHTYVCTLQQQQTHYSSPSPLPLQSPILTHIIPSLSLSTHLTAILAPSPFPLMRLPPVHPLSTYCLVSYCPSAHQLTGAPPVPCSILAIMSKAALNIITYGKLLHKPMILPLKYKNNIYNL